MNKGYALLCVAEQYLFFLRLYFSSRYALALFLLTGKSASVPINSVDMNGVTAIPVMSGIPNLPYASLVYEEFYQLLW